MKYFLYDLFQFFTKIIMWIPFHSIRLLYLKLILGGLGKHSTVARNVEIRKPKNIFIGSNCVINTRVLLDGRGGKLKIGDNVDIAQDTFIWTLQHDYNDDYHSTIGGNVTIDDYVWIAARSNILPNVHISKGVVVGTCSLVTKSINTANLVVAGIPAKTIAVRNSNLKYKLYHKPWFQ